MGNIAYGSFIRKLLVLVGLLYSSIFENVYWTLDESWSAWSDNGPRLPRKLQKNCRNTTLQLQLKDRAAKRSRCSFETELSEVRREFDRMVASFSGGSHMVKTERHNHREVPNMFRLKYHFANVYQSRRDDDFEY